MQSGDYEQALAPLQKAEEVQGSARSELLLALTYQRMKKFDEAHRYLDLAKHRLRQGGSVGPGNHWPASIVNPETIPPRSTR